jgi:hypothetical protein
VRIGPWWRSWPPGPHSLPIDLGGVFVDLSILSRASVMKRETARDGVGRTPPPVPTSLTALRARTSTIAMIGAIRGRPGAYLDPFSKRVASMLHGIPGNGSECQGFCGFPAQRVAQAPKQLGPPLGGPKLLCSLAYLMVAGERNHRQLTLAPVLI